MGNSAQPQHGNQDRSSREQTHLHQVLESHKQRRRSIEMPLSFNTERVILQKALRSYTTETLDYIYIVRDLSRWINERNKDLKKLKDIKNRADKLKGDSNTNEGTSKLGEQIVLSRKLYAVLKDTLKGLKTLHCFLDPLKKLATTSLPVFMEDKHLEIHLPTGISLELIHETIEVARQMFHQLCKSKEKADSFPSFLQSLSPKLQNCETISSKLDGCIPKTEVTSNLLKISPLFQVSMGTSVKLSEDLSEDEIKRMLSHIKQLTEIRENLQLSEASKIIAECMFIREFEQRQPRIQQHLKKLDEIAEQLVSINKRARVSGIVGSSVGVVGSLLTIAGLALTPVTAGASVALASVGTVMAGTSGASAVVISATEIGVNKTQEKKVKDILNEIKEDLEAIQACLTESISQHVIGSGDDQLNIRQAVAGTVLKLDSFAAAGLGRFAAKEAALLGKTIRASIVGLNAVFVVMDAIFIRDDATRLAEGSETKFSKFIRDAAAQVDSQLKMYDSCYSQMSRHLLEETFYQKK